MSEAFEKWQRIFAEQYGQYPTVGQTWAASIERGRREMREPMTCGHPKACEDESAQASTSYIGPDGETVVSGCGWCSDKATARREALEAEANRIISILESRCDLRGENGDGVDSADPADAIVTMISSRINRAVEDAIHKYRQEADESVRRADAAYGGDWRG